MKGFLKLFTLITGSYTVKAVTTNTSQNTRFNVLQTSVSAASTDYTAVSSRCLQLNWTKRHETVVKNDISTVTDSAHAGTDATMG